MAEPTADGPTRPRHVVLVGMMGSGKTTVGRRVARRLDRPFRDADEVLEERSGLSVREWFELKGETAFRDAEVDTLVHLLAADEPSVIAAGGGVVVRPENRAALGRALVIWLDGDPAFLASRVAQREHRPLIDDDPSATIHRLHAERAGWYREVADEVVEITPVHLASDKPKRDLADIVVGLVRTREAAAGSTR